MRTLPAFVLLASIGTVAIAQNQPPAPQQPPPSQQPKTAAPEAKPAAEIDPQLQKVMKAYSQADNLSDTIKLDVKTPMGNQEQEMKVVLGEGTDSQMSMTGLSMTFHDGKLYMVRDDVADKYFVTAVEGGIFTTVENVLGNTGLLPMHILLSTDELKSDEDVLNAITMGAVPQPRITGTTTVKNDDGQDMQELKFEGQGGQGTVQVDPKTSFVHKVAVQVTPQGAPPGTVIDATMTMSPKVAEGAAKIAFEPGARTAVSSLDELKPTPVAVGQPAA